MYMKFFNYTQTDENLFKFSEERRKDFLKSTQVIDNNIFTICALCIFFAPLR